MSRAQAASTLRAYAHDWRHFRLWCERHHLVALPATPQTVVLYATDLIQNDKRKLNTLYRRLAAIGQIHEQTNLEPPSRSWAVRQYLAGLRGEAGPAPNRKRPVSIEDLKQIVAGIPDTLLGKRDRALLLLGFAGALRRSELVALDMEDLEPVREGLIVWIRCCKTGQQGQGRPVGIPRGSEAPTCPVQALDTWCSAARIESGPIFRRVNRHGHVLPKRLSGEAVGIVVKRYVEQLGWNPGLFAGHSLRSRLAMSTAAAGKGEPANMHQTGHRAIMVFAPAGKAVP
jgi:integrase